MAVHVPAGPVEVEVEVEAEAEAEAEAAEAMGMRRYWSAELAVARPEA